jgi:hypothetical protein
MERIIAPYEPLIERFVEWARPRKDIRAAIMIGSRARAERPADGHRGISRTSRFLLDYWTNPEREKKITSARGKP